MCATNKGRMATDVDRCTRVFRSVEGLGPVARFDALSTDSACKRLYAEGTPAVRDALVQRFCNQFPADRIPARCKCYRFKETADYARYSSLWADLLAGGKGGVAGDPLAGSFVCFAPACAADPDSYKTSDMQATLTQGGCPSVVYCKQQVGDVSISTKGRSLADISLEIQQKCGRGANAGGDNDAEPNTDGDEPGANSGPEAPVITWPVRLSWQQAAAMAGVALLVLVLVLLVLRR